MRPRVTLVVAALAAAASACAAEATPTGAGSPTPDATPTAAAEEPTPSATPVPVAAFLSIAEIGVGSDVVTVGGFVTGVAEDDGDCAFVLAPEQGGQDDEVVARTRGIENVSTTSCGSADVPLEDLSRGSWTVTLRYSSPTASVSSEPATVEVP